jgi:hypothetical protein
MRCLYCGKELALLKRWTGGGEFCSDAHRQQYQEEYNQLALTRLLQAKPGAKNEAAPAESAPAQRPAAAVEKPVPAAKAEIPEPEIRRAAVAPREIPAPKPEPQAPEPAEPEPVAEIAEVAVEVAEEEPAPAEAYGFLLELPVPVDAAFALAALSGVLEQALVPEFPHCEAAEPEADLAPAGRVALAPSSRVLDFSTRMAPARPEVREFVRPAPVVQFDLAPASETGLLDTSEESMDIVIFPQPPQGSPPPLWQTGATAFAFGCELGGMARATFRTTGIEDQDDDLTPMPAETAPEQIVELAHSNPSPQPQQSAPLPEQPSAPPPAPAARIEPPAPAISVKVVPKSVAAPAVFRPASAAVPAPEKPAAKPAERVPDLITRPLPLTLHGLTAGRGKPVQVFQTAVAGDLEIQSPRSSALPLRPVMTFGPAPARSERTVVVKPEAKKTEVKKPDVRKPEAKKPEVAADDKKEEKKEEKKSPQVRPEPRPVAAKAPVAEPQPAVKPEPVLAAPVVAPKPEPKPEPIPAFRNEPAATPYSSLDLGLPKLTVDSGSFWSKLPPAGKIGIAAAAVIVVVVAAILALRSGGSTVVANSPQVVAGSPLPAPETGWITDWGAEPGLRREHEISVLRPSLSLSDYRMEFEAEIESKAIGWVFRAIDGKNYYVAKLEVVTPGLEPKVEAVHFAVVNGQPQERAHTPLPMKVRIDTLYKVRFDAIGDRFSTFVQDEKVDDWTDDRLKTGGVGLYNDRGERMTLKGGVSVVPLVIKR